MKTCKIEFCDNTELVHSGVDAFLLGIPSETYCYDCVTHGYAKMQMLEEDK